MKKLILILITIFSIQMVNSQNLDQATVNKIRVKLIGAEKSYGQGEYWDTLDKIKEIEAISKGMKSAKVQNLKVKAYIGAEMYIQSKEELDKLYNMNPDDEIIGDIASYESKIDNGIKEEKAREERARHYEIKRKEDARLAEIQRKEEVRLTEIKEEEKKERIEKALFHFKYEPCTKCHGEGIEDYEASKKCTASYSGPRRGGGMKNYYGGCNGGKCWHKKKGNSREYFTCTTCNGSGKVKYKSTRACLECQGTLYKLKYIGNDNLSIEEIDMIMKKNHLQIVENIHKKEKITYDVEIIDAEYVKNKVLGQKINVWRFDSISEFKEVRILRKNKLQNGRWMFDVEFLLISSQRSQFTYLRAAIYFEKGYKSWDYKKGDKFIYDKYSKKTNLN